MNKLILKQEVLDAYDGYVKAFIKGDTKEVNYLSFPNYRFVNVRFISQIENFKRMIKCRLKLSNLELPLSCKSKYEVI